jgi:hypothetical protein
MANELMPCPICGESCTSYREFAELPAKVQCDVMLCNYAPESASRAEGIEQHNTLARRAEIGALVERIVEAAPGLLTIGRTAMTAGVTIYSAWSSKPFTDERSLLDALRALAKEVGCE